MFPFDRLVNEVHKITKYGYNEEFYVQYGHTKVDKTNLRGKAFLNEDEFDVAIEECSCLITHAGTSNIIKALKKKKKIIIVPRLKVYGEHVDDHQVEIADFVEDNNFGLVIHDISELKNNLTNINNMKFEEYLNDNSMLLNDINNFIVGGV
jgi:UDP-N-acetylglucosamine transferase subunit ALG13